MKARFWLFAILGTVAGASIGYATTIMMLPPAQAFLNHPAAEMSDAYAKLAVRGATIWAVLGFVHGAVLFFWF